jgi:hypothetical protein
LYRRTGGRCGMRKIDALMITILAPIGAGIFLLALYGMLEIGNIIHGFVK